LDDLKRISRLQEQCDTVSCIPGWDGAQAWMRTLSSLDREVSPYITKEEYEALDKLRLMSLPGITHRKLLGQSPPSWVLSQLDAWERQLRYLIAKRGMGLIAKDMDRNFMLPGG
jgi:hypothetical protein